MENREKKSLLYKLLIATAIMIPLIIGFSYAYFLAYIKGTENPTIISGNVVSEFEFELQTENDGYISGTNMIPIPDSDINNYANVGTFKVVAGDNKYPISYTISLTNVTITNGLKNTDFKWELICTECRTNKIVSGNFATYINGEDFVLKSDTLMAANSSHNYKLRLWVSETTADQSNILNQTFKAKVKATAEFVINDNIISDTLPTEYQEVEYLESNGTQYIDTGITPNNTTNIEVTFMNGNSSIANQRVYGQINTAGDKRYQLNMNNTNTASWLFGINGTNYTIAMNTTTNYKTIKFVSGTGLYVDNNLVQAITKVETNSYNIWLYRGYDKYSAIKISSVAIWKDGALVRNFVPCYRKSDNVAGLYDLITNEFYINAGTDDFIVGPNVN